MFIFCNNSPNRKHSSLSLYSLFYCNIINLNFRRSSKIMNESRIVIWIDDVPGVRGGRGDDVPLDGDGDSDLLLHLARGPVPDEHSAVHGQRLAVQPTLTVRISVQNSEHEPLELTPALSVVSRHVFCDLWQILDLLFRWLEYYRPGCYFFCQFEDF